MIGRTVRMWNGWNRQRKAIIVAIGAVMLVPLLAFAYWTISPLLFDREVDEAFPAAQPQVVNEVVVEQPQAQVEQPAPAGQPATAPAAEPAAVQLEDPAEQPAAPAEQAAAPAPEAPAEPVALSSGSFTVVDDLHQASGTATIYQLPDGQRVLRFENFESTNGPDLFVGLSSHPMPRTSEEVHEGTYVELAGLKGNKGNQNYAIPAELDLRQFQSVVIYCRAFSVVFSTAELVTP